MSYLVADGLHFGWSPETLLFENLSVSLSNERAALVGANGAGKTTLLRLLTGQLTPSAGTVATSGALLYLPQLSDPALTIAAALGIDDKLAALTRMDAGEASEADYAIIGADWDIEERARKALHQTGAPPRDWAVTLGQLSGGEAMRVRLARAFLQRPDLLILDEPTNNLDTDGLNALYDLIAAWPGGLLVVSHHRGLLAKMDRILDLTSLGLKSYGGGYDAYVEAKAAQHAAAQHRLSDAARHLKSSQRDAQTRLEKAQRHAAHGKRVKAGSQPKMVIDGHKRRAQQTAGRTQNLNARQTTAAHSALEDARADIEHTTPLAFDVPSSGLASGKTVLKIESLTVYRPEREAPVINAFNLQIVGPERIALLGPNGAGKSTLLQTITADLTPTQGTLHLGVDHLARLSQDIASLDPGLSILDAFTAQNPEQTPNQARAALARFGFRNTAADALIGGLSGGERLRAALAATLMSAHPPQLLILDEPTNHMDLDAALTLQAALTAYDGALLIASHDQPFLNAINITRHITLAPAPIEARPAAD